MLDFGKHPGLKSDLESYDQVPLEMAFLCKRVEAGFDVFERSKQALNEDNFAAALERNTLREFPTENARHEAQRKLIQKQLFLRLHYLGAWLQIALAMGELERICSISLAQEKRILGRNVIQEDGEIHSRFYETRHQAMSFPVVSFHAKWLSLQDPATMAKCIKATARLYQQCASGCDNPAEGATLPKLPFTLLDFNSRNFGMMEWTIGGTSFSYYCGYWCRFHELNQAANLDDAAGKVKHALTRLNNKRQDRSRALSFINRSAEKERYEATDLQYKSVEDRLAGEFKSLLDEAEGVARKSLEYTCELRRFVSIIRERQKHLREFEAKHGQSMEWLAAMYTFVVVVLRVRESQVADAAWAEVREHTYAPLRQELVRKAALDQAWETDARSLFLEAVAGRKPLANEVLIPVEAD